MARFPASREASICIYASTLYFLDDHPFRYEIASVPLLMQSGPETKPDGSHAGALCNVKRHLPVEQDYATPDISPASTLKYFTHQVRPCTLSTDLPSL